MSGRVRDYYDGFDEWGRLDADAGALEFQQTLGLLDRFLPEGASVLDLGAGPGRYAIELCRRGHAVTLADLSPVLVGQARERAERAGVELAACDVADARRLPYADAAFEAAVVLGPFYHLPDEADRRTAALELARVVQPGGVAIVAFLPRLSAVADLIGRAARSPEQISAETFSTALLEGSFHNRAPTGFQEGWFATPDEIGQLLTGAGFGAPRMISVRGLAYRYESALSSIPDDELRQRMLEAVETTRDDPHVVASCGHALAIAKR